MRKFVLGLLAGVLVAGVSIYFLTRPAHQSAQQQVETATPIVVDLSSLSKDQREILARGLVAHRQAIDDAARKALEELNSSEHDFTEQEAQVFYEQRIQQARQEHPYPPAEFFEDLGIADEMLKGRPVVFERRAGTVDPLKQVELP